VTLMKMNNTSSRLAKRVVNVTKPDGRKLARAA